MPTQVLIAIVALGCLGFAGFGVLAWRPAIAPVAPPAQGAEKFAGGYAMTTLSA
jgi:hypothetical protein